MKSKMFQEMIGNIDDDLIVAADVRAVPMKKKTLKWISSIAAACLVIALGIICAPTLIHILNSSGVDDPRSGEQYNFNSYSELCSILPKENVIANVPNSEKAQIEAYVICPDGTVDFADYNNYSYLSVDISYNDGTGINIFCTVNSEVTAEGYIESKSLTFTPEKTSVVTVENCQVYYADFENDNTNGVNAVFSIDGSLYDIKTDSFNREELIQYIEKMLK